MDKKLLLIIFISVISIAVGCYFVAVNYTTNKITTTNKESDRKWKEATKTSETKFDVTTGSKIDEIKP